MLVAASGVKIIDVAVLVRGCEAILLCPKTYLVMCCIPRQIPSTGKWMPWSFI